MDRLIGTMLSSFLRVAHFETDQKELYNPEINLEEFIGMSW